MQPQAPDGAPPAPPGSMFNSPWAAPHLKIHPPQLLDASDSQQQEAERITASVDGASQLLERWEKARIRQDRRRQEQQQEAGDAGDAGLDGSPVDSYRPPGSPSLASPLTSPRRNSKLHTTTAGERQGMGRTRRGSEMMLRPGDGQPLFKDHSDLLRKLQLDGVQPPMPVGSRKTRRNSYSVGYTTDMANPFAKMSQPSSPGQEGAPQPLPWTTSAGPLRTASNAATRGPGRTTPPWLSQPAQNTVSADLREDPRKEDTRTSTQAHTPSLAIFQGNRVTVTTPLAVSPSPSEAVGLGGKLRKLLGRTASRVNILRPLTSQSVFMERDAPSSVAKESRSMFHMEESIFPDADLRRSDSSGGEPAPVPRSPGISYPISSDPAALAAGATGADMRLVGLASSASFKKGMHNKANSQLRPLITLSPFVPRLLMDEIASKHDRYQVFDQGAVRELGKASTGLQPSMSEFQGAVMIADVKGFTQLTEILSKKGTAGVELLTNCMNNYFTRVINMILVFDGDVVKFAGDSMIVVFSPTPSEARGEDQGIRAATLRCAQCAHVLATKLGHMRMKMNGQVEPINVAATNDSIDLEEGGIMDTDLLRRHGGKRNARISTTMATMSTIAFTPPASANAPHVPGNMPLPPSLVLDSRGMMAVQHAAQQVAALNISNGTNTSDGSQQRTEGGSQASPTRSGSGRGSPASHPDAPGSGSSQLPELYPTDIMDGNSTHLDVALTSMGGSATSAATSGPPIPVSGDGVSFSKTKRASWLTSVIGSKRYTGGSTSSTNSKGGKSDGPLHVSTGSVANANALATAAAAVAAANAAANGNSPVSSPAHVLRGGRSRARTEVGLLGTTAGLREPANARGAAAAADSSLWGEGAGGGMVRREMSLASKLNIPPPVRPITQNASRNSSITPGASFGASDLPHTQSAQIASFTANDAHSRMGGITGVGARRGPTESWASKFQNLQSGVMGSAPEHNAAFQIERSHTSLGAVRPLLPPPPEINPADSADDSDCQRSQGSQPENIDISGSLAVLQSGPSRSGPSRSAASRSRLGMLRPHLFGGGPKKGSSSNNLQDGGPAALARATSNSATKLVQVADMDEDGIQDLAPQAPTGVVEWSEDSYAVDILETSALNGAGPSSPTLAARGRAGPSSRRGGGVNGARVPNISNVNIGGYMAPPSTGQPIGEGSESNSPAMRGSPFPGSTLALLQGSQGSLLIQGTHSNPRMLLPAASHTPTGPASPALQASQLTSLSICSLHSTPPRTQPSSSALQGIGATGSTDSGSFQWRLPRHRAASGELQQQGGNAGPVAEGLFSQHHHLAASRDQEDDSPTGGPVAEGIFKRGGLISYGAVEPLGATISEGGGTEVLARQPAGGGNGSMPNYAYDLGSRRATAGAMNEKASFIGKVRGWFGSATSKKTAGGQGDGRDGDRDDLSTGSASPSNSFGYPTAPMGRIQAVAPTYTKTRDPVMEEVQNSEFSLKIMISAGSICVFQVGGLIDEVTDPTMPEVPHWEFFIGDRPMAPLRDANNRRRCIAQLALIEDQAEAGEVVGSREVIDLMQDEWDMDLLPDDVGKLRGPVRPFIIPQRPAQTLVRMMRPMASKHRRASQVGEDDDAGAEGGVAGGEEEEEAREENAPAEFSQLPDNIQRRMAGVLRMHVLGSVRSRIEAGHLDFINEIRPLTCMFLGFPSLLQETDTASHDDQISCVQYCITKVQEVMRKWDGSLLQFRADEKGFVGICAFGLPGHTHEDNPSRGILAALDLHARIKLKNHRVAIGVTTGDLLCTCVGARKIRSEYTVFGDAINLSARLMVKCKKGSSGDILCDEPTHAHAKFKACFDELEPLTVKGKKLPVHVFHVSPFDKDTAAANAAAENQAMDNQGGPRQPGSADRPLVGRDTETSFILNRAANMIAGMATGGAIVIEGNTGMGKTKLLTEVRKSLERIHADTLLSGKPAFHLFFGVADIANKNSKLHPWRRTFQELFAMDRHSSLQQNTQQPAEPGSRTSTQPGAISPTTVAALNSTMGRSSASTAAAAVTALGNQLASQIASYNAEWSKHLAELIDIPVNQIPRGSYQPLDDFVTAAGSGHIDTPPTSQGFAQSQVQMQTPPLAQTPMSLLGATPLVVAPGLLSAQLTAAGEFSNVMTSPSTPRYMLSSSGGLNPGAGQQQGVALGGVDGLSFRAGNDGSSIMGRALAGAWAGIGSLTGNTSMRAPRSTMPQQQSPMVPTAATLQGTSGTSGTRRMLTLDSNFMSQGPTSGLDGSGLNALSQGERSTIERTVPSMRATSLIAPAMLVPSRSLSMRRSPNMQSTAAAVPGPAPIVLGPPPALTNAGPSTLHVASLAGPSLMGPSNATPGAAPLKKNSLNFLVHVIREYTSLYGPIVIMFENLHEFDTWSWQLLVKVAEVLSPSVLILATTRPIELSPNPGSQVHSKAALYQKVATMYRHLLKLPTTSRVHLEPFTFQQTKALMQVLADNHIFPDQYVLAVKEKTGGMPLYIEKVTEFLCQKPWLAEQGGEFTATVNKMIRNLNFQQVIIERMDRLKPVIHLTLKVASVMGQWVDLDILYKFYPLNNSKDELRGHLAELERGNFLKPTDTDGVWEFNMVERDIVYEVIPHYQRRRLHAKLAQELERSLEEHHVATLTTIAYHWNQACMGHEVTEVECALKAIEYWQRAAEAGYSGSSLMEALRLYQKAAQIAELLGDSMSNSFQANASQRPSTDGGAGPSNRRRRGGGGGGGDGDGDGGSTSGQGDEDGDDEKDDNNASFTAVGAAFRGQLNWSLISRITRAQWEKSMASCCLGIVMQHRLEFNNQMEFWDSEDYFELLTEHAIRGLMLLGAPHPTDVLLQDKPPTLVSKIFCCFSQRQDEPSGWQEGVVLQDQEVTEIRDILLVLIIAAEHYSLQQDGNEYIRLLTFCKRVCIFFNKCSDTGLDPFTDIQLACNTRIKNFRTRKGPSTANDFDLNAPMTGDLLGEGAAFNTGHLDIAGVVALNQVNLEMLAGGGSRQGLGYNG